MAMTSHGPAPAWFAALLLAAGCHLLEGQALDPFPDVTGALLECGNATHCPRERAICASGTCVECVVDADCGRGELACVGSSCVESGVAGEGGASDDGSHEDDDLSDVGKDAGSCDIEDARCPSSCSGAADCPSKKPICDVSAGCVACTDDASCADPKRPACSIEHECVACTRDAHCTDPAKPACITSSQRCGECTADAHCPAGALCELPAARCVLPDVEPPPAADAGAPTTPGGPVPPHGPAPRS